MLGGILSQNLLYHLAMHIGQPMIASLVAVRQSAMVDAQAAQHRRMEIVDVDRILDDVVREVIGLAERDAGLDAAAREPKREAARVMIAAIVVSGQRALAVDGAAEFPAPEDERVVEQATRLQVLDERGRGLIGIARPDR